MEINMQEWDEIKPSKSNPKIKIERLFFEIFIILISTSIMPFQKFLIKKMN